MHSLEALIEWYETLTPQSLERISDIYADDAQFSDPFNHAKGPAEIALVFEHMFATLASPRFVVKKVFPADGEAMLLWHFHFSLNGRAVMIEGASRLEFNAAGKVLLHCDYWDSSAGLLQKLPIIGGLFRWLARRFSARRKDAPVSSVEMQW